MASSKGKARWRRWVPASVWMAAIFGVSSLPNVPCVGALELSDKLLHGMAYAVLGALVWRALDPRRPGWIRVAGTVAVAAAYGYSDEIHQRFVVGRCYDMLDLAADTAGATVASVCCLGWEKIRSRGRR